jgi:hypothetical protein
VVAVSPIHFHGLCAGRRPEQEEIFQQENIPCREMGQGMRRLTAHFLADTLFERLSGALFLTSQAKEEERKSSFTLPTERQEASF